MTATDLDSGSNGEITYAISKGNDGDTFEIDGKGNDMLMICILNVLFNWSWRFQSISP